MQPALTLRRLASVTAQIVLLCCALLIYRWPEGKLVLASLDRHLLAHQLPRGWELREALEKLDKDLYDNGPGPDRPFVAALKNPCWVVKAPNGGGRRASGGDGANTMNCLPYSMVIGGFHCGAASLWQALYKHPLVAKSDVSRWHFWAEFDKMLPGYLEGIARGAARVMSWPKQVELAMQTGGGAAAVAGVGEAGGLAWLRRQQKILLDGSSSTFAFYWSPNVRAHRAFVKAMVPCWGACHKEQQEGPERDTCLESCYVIAREADRKLADSIGIPYNDISLPLLISAVYGRRPPKMVVLMRNPVDRLYSAYWRYSHYRDKYGPSTEGFETYARQQLSGLRACMTRNGSASEVSCLLHFETWGIPEERLYFHADQLLRGMYSVWLETWFKFFDRRDLLVLRSEDYFADPVEVFGRVAEWLGLEPSAIDYHRRLEALGRASDVDQAAAAMTVPVDEKLWAEIKAVLLEGKDLGETERYAINRQAAQAAEEKMQQARQRKQGGDYGRDGDGDFEDAGAGSGAVGGSRPPMPEAIRRELLQFYAPYNRRLAELLQEPNFIRGWDQ